MKKIIKITFCFVFTIMMYSVMSVNVEATTSGIQGGVTKINPSSIKIINSPGNMNVGDTKILKITINPSNASDTSVSWSSSDKNIVTVDKNGKITAKKNGTVKISVKTSNGKTDSIPITVKNDNTNEKKEPTTLKISNPPKIILTDTNKVKLKTNKANGVTWSSSDKSVATVDKSGYIYPKKVGVVTITAKSGNLSDKVKINIISIKFKEKNIKLYTKSEADVTVITEVPISYDDFFDNIKWLSSDAKQMTVTSQNNYSNAYGDGKSFTMEWKATIKANKKQAGKAKLTFKLLDQQKSVDIEIIEKDSDYSINCPDIYYDTSNSETISMTIHPDNTISRYNIQISNNGMIGQDASWSRPLYINETTHKTFNFKRSDMQAKIVVYSKNGKSSRSCYSAPFNYKKMTQNWSIQCPDLKPKKINYMEGQSESTSLYINVPDDNYNDKKHTGVKSVQFTVDKQEKNNIYQYSWYDNNDYKIADHSKAGLDERGNSIEDEKFFWKPKLKGTFSSKKSFTLDTTTGVKISDQDENLLPIHGRQGIYLAMDQNGNVRICQTDGYTGFSYKQEKNIGDTSVYIQTGISCPVGEKTYNYLKEIKNNSSYLFSSSNGEKLNSIFISNNSFGCFAQGHNFINLPCNNKDSYIAPIHELAHVWDSMNSITDNTSSVSEKSTVYDKLRLKYKYGSQYDAIDNQHNYSWYYNQSYGAKKEFFAGIYTHYYLNKYYGNKSNSDIDKLPVHDEWKWILKDKTRYPSDVNAFLQQTIKDYK